MERVSAIVTSQGLHDPDEILDYKYYDEDSDTNSLREYFQALLTLVIVEDKGFDGKRPFGNSGWKYLTILKNLAIQGVIASKMTIERNEYGEEQFEVDCLDSEEGMKVVMSLLKYMFYEGA